MTTSEGEDDLDAIAAEFVLGTLSGMERTAVVKRRAAEALLDAAIVAWEARLAPLSETIPPATPPAAVFAGIERRLDAAPPAAANDNAAVLARSVRRWRGLALSASALAAALLLTIGLRESARVTPPDVAATGSFVAVLQRDASSPATLVSVDLVTRQLTARPLGVVAPAGKSYELWLIAGGQPRSLGLLGGDGAPTRASLALEAAAIEKATYAVTLEQAGGSPAGAPTSAPILVGTLVPVR